MDFGNGKFSSFDFLIFGWALDLGFGAGIFTGWDGFLWLIKAELGACAWVFLLLLLLFSQISLGKEGRNRTGMGWRKGKRRKSKRRE